MKIRLANNDQVTDELNELKLRIARINARRNAQINALQRDIITATTTFNLPRTKQDTFKMGNMYLRNDEKNRFRSTSVLGSQPQIYAHNWRYLSHFSLPRYLSVDNLRFGKSYWSRPECSRRKSVRFGFGFEHDLHPVVKQCIPNDNESFTVNNKTASEKERFMKQLFRKLGNSKLSQVTNKLICRPSEKMQPSSFTEVTVQPHITGPKKKDVPPFLGPVNEKDNFYKRYNAFAEKILTPLKKHNTTMRILEKEMKKTRQSLSTTVASAFDVTKTPEKAYSQYSNHTRKTLTFANYPIVVPNTIRTFYSNLNDCMAADCSDYDRVDMRNNGDADSKSAKLRYAWRYRKATNHWNLPSMVTSNFMPLQSHCIYTPDNSHQPIRKVRPVYKPSDVESTIRNSWYDNKKAVTTRIHTKTPHLSHTGNLDHDNCSYHHNYRPAYHYQLSNNNSFKSNTYPRSSLPSWKQYYYTQKLESKPNKESFLDLHNKCCNFFPGNASDDPVDELLSITSSSEEGSPTMSAKSIDVDCVDPITYGKIFRNSRSRKCRFNDGANDMVNTSSYIQHLTPSTASLVMLSSVSSPSIPSLKILAEEMSSSNKDLTTVYHLEKLPLNFPSNYRNSSFSTTVTNSKSDKMSVMTSSPWNANISTRSATGIVANTTTTTTGLFNQFHLGKMHPHDLSSKYSYSSYSMCNFDKDIQRKQDETPLSIYTKPQSKYYNSYLTFSKYEPPLRSDYDDKQRSVNPIKLTENNVTNRPMHSYNNNAKHNLAVERRKNIITTEDNIFAEKVPNRQANDHLPKTSSSPIWFPRSSGTCDNEYKETKNSALIYDSDEQQNETELVPTNEPLHTMTETNETLNKLHSNYQQFFKPDEIVPFTNQNSNSYDLTSTSALPVNQTSVSISSSTTQRKAYITIENIINCPQSSGVSVLSSNQSSSIPIQLPSILPSLSTTWTTTPASDLSRQYTSSRLISNHKCSSINILIPAAHTSDINNTKTQQQRIDKLSQSRKSSIVADEKSQLNNKLGETQQYQIKDICNQFNEGNRSLYNDLPSTKHITDLLTKDINDRIDDVSIYELPHNNSCNVTEQPETRMNDWKLTNIGIAKNEIENVINNSTECNVKDTIDSSVNQIENDFTKVLTDQKSTCQNGRKGSDDLSIEKYRNINKNLEVKQSPDDIAGRNKEIYAEEFSNYNVSYLGLYNESRNDAANNNSSYSCTNYSNNQEDDRIKSTICTSDKYNVHTYVDQVSENDLQLREHNVNQYTDQFCHQGHIPFTQQLKELSGTSYTPATLLIPGTHEIIQQENQYCEQNRESFQTEHQELYCQQTDEEYQQTQLQEQYYKGTDETYWQSNLQQQQYNQNIDGTCQQLQKQEAYHKKTYEGYQQPQLQEQYHRNTNDKYQQSGRQEAYGQKSDEGYQQPQLQEHYYQNTEDKYQQSQKQEAYHQKSNEGYQQLQPQEQYYQNTDDNYQQSERQEAYYQKSDKGYQQPQPQKQYYQNVNDKYQESQRQEGYHQKSDKGYQEPQPQEHYYQNTEDKYQQSQKHEAYHQKSNEGYQQLQPQEQYYQNTDDNYQQSQIQEAHYQKFDESYQQPQLQQQYYQNIDDKYQQSQRQEAYHQKSDKGYQEPQPQEKYYQQSDEKYQQSQKQESNISYTGKTQQQQLQQGQYHRQNVLDYDYETTNNSEYDNDSANIVYLSTEKDSAQSLPPPLSHMCYSSTITKDEHIGHQDQNIEHYNYKVEDSVNNDAGFYNPHNNYEEEVNWDKQNNSTQWSTIQNWDENDKCTNRRNSKDKYNYNKNDNDNNYDPHRNQETGKEFFDDKYLNNSPIVNYNDEYPHYFAKGDTSQMSLPEQLNTYIHNFITTDNKDNIINTSDIDYYTEDNFHNNNNNNNNNNIKQTEFLQQQYYNKEEKKEEKVNRQPEEFHKKQEQLSLNNNIKDYEEVKPDLPSNFKNESSLSQQEDFVDSVKVESKIKNIDNVQRKESMSDRFTDSDVNNSQLQPQLQQAVALKKMNSIEYVGETVQLQQQQHQMSTSVTPKGTAKEHNATVTRRASKLIAQSSSSSSSLEDKKLKTQGSLHTPTNSETQTQMQKRASKAKVTENASKLKRMPSNVSKAKIPSTVKRM